MASPRWLYLQLSDLRIANATLSQLSYRPKRRKNYISGVASPAGIEPAIFPSYHYGFRRPHRVCGLDSILTMSLKRQQVAPVESLHVLAI